jgi:hypothetical protein
MIKAEDDYLSCCARGHRSNRFLLANRELTEAAIEELMQDLRANGSDLYSGT